MLGLPLLLLFLNDFPDVLNVPTLLFNDDAKIVTRHEQKGSLQPSNITTWG